MLSATVGDNVIKRHEDGVHFNVYRYGVGWWLIRATQADAWHKAATVSFDDACRMNYNLGAGYGVCDDLPEPPRTKPSQSSPDTGSTR